jgi:general secretion pathway protein D
MGQGFGTQGAVGTPPAAGGTSFSDRLQRIIQKASTSGEIVVFGQTKMIADERTNSLLIYASRDDMKTIKDIINKLDVVLAQVLIEAVVISVSLNDAKSYGLSYIEKQSHGVGSFAGLGAINNGPSFSSSPLVSGATNLAGNLQGGFNYLASFGNDLDVTITALASDSRAKILQRPRIQTSHNETAHLFVGESRPYPTSSYYGGGAFGGYSSIQQLPIGVSLDVTPLINPDGLVVMEISQDIESVNGSVTIANVGDVPITSQKTASTKVSVRDHDTIILGGLIEDSNDKKVAGVPFLMDIPVLGYLFRNNTTTVVRNELIVLIRPTVLPTPEVAALAARSEKDKMPMVKKYEAEIQTEDNKRLKKSEKN